MPLLLLSLIIFKIIYVENVMHYFSGLNILSGLYDVDGVCMSKWIRTNTSHYFIWVWSFCGHYYFYLSLLMTQVADNWIYLQTWMIYVYIPDSNVGWPDVGPTSVLSSRRWANVRPTYIAVWDLYISSHLLVHLRNSSISKIRDVDNPSFRCRI